MHPFYFLLGLFALFCVAALVWLVRWERRKFTALGKGAAWLPVRIASIPILLAIAAIIIVPTSNTSGMEALGVFYILLLTVAPLFWFVAHWIVGKFVKPPLSFGESAQIAVSPILLLFALGWLAQWLQPLVWVLLVGLGIEEY